MTDANARTLVAAVTPSTLPAQTQSWLDELDRAVALSEDDYPPSIRQRLIYVLAIVQGADGPPRAVVEPKSVRLLKDGGFAGNAATYNPQSAFSGTPAKFLRGDDMSILRRIAHLRGLYWSGGQGHALAGEPGGEIIERVLATGRCRWGSLDGPPMGRAEPRRGRIAWTLLDNGAQRPVATVEGGGIALDLVPPWYIDVGAAVCGPLQLDLPPGVAAALLRSPAIDPHHVAVLRDRIARRLGERSDLLPAEPRPAEVIKGPPVPVLRLARRPLPPAGWGYSWRSPSSTPPREDVQTARLAFAYGAFEFPAGERRDKPLFARDGQLFAVERDRRLESGHEKRLRADDVGLMPAESRRYELPADARDDLVLGDDDGDGDGDGDAFAWPRFLVKVAPRLRDEGWRIEIEPGFVPPLAKADDDFNAGLHEGSGIDWFEFDVGISVDGQRVNLLPRIIDLLRAVPDDAGSEFFDRDDDGEETLFITLDDGRLLPLPYAKIQPILTALHELFRMDLAVAGDSVAINRTRAAELAELEDLLGESGVKWSGGEALRRLGRKLREFGSVGERPAPDGFAETLRPYQSLGFAWLNFLGEAGLGGILADDMGLGKTVQALAHLLAEKAEGRADRPSLVVAPTSLMANWRMEAERFAPALKVLTLHGPERKARFAAIGDHDLVLSTFALLARDRDVLLAQPWHAVIVDEAQNIKNPDTNAARILRLLDVRQRFCLTGTPVENHLGELWALMDFLNPGLLGDRRQFTRTFRTPIEKAGDMVRRDALVRRVRPFMLRRTKGKVAGELPEKTEIIEPIEMDPGQSAIYEAVRLTMHRKVREAIAAKGLERSRIIILDALLKLRQVCCDPRLVKLPSVKKTNAGSAKLTRLIEMLGELVEEGRRVLLFSQFTSMLALIEEWLAASAIDFVKITGQVSDRATPVARFQAGEVPVFLISLKAGGTGLNLTAADTVILYDPWWNPAVEAQAIDRSHRIGQEKPVFVHRLVTLGTIEEKMIELQRRKGALAEGLFDPEAAGPLDIGADEIELLLASS